MLIQEFLRNGGTFVELESKYGISAKQHPSYPSLWLLKYDQIESPFAEAIVCECRGIILDSTNNWNVVARSFDKFFNYGEGHADVIDWNTARVQEKVDGSLCQLYFYADKWHVATSGTPDASGQVNGFDFTFKDLFWKTWNEGGYSLANANPEYTYMFELTSPFNRVVVVHKEPGLTYLGCRNNKTGQERRANSCTLNKWPKVVKEFSLSSFDGIIASFDGMNPLAQEGYVVVDAQFRRNKVKCPQYVALHHMRDGFGSRRIIEVVRMGEVSEFITYFPEFKEQFDDIKLKYDNLVAELQSIYDANSHLTVQKDFALAIKHATMTGPLFSLRNGKVKSIKQALQEMNVVNLQNSLKIRETTSNIV